MKVLFISDTHNMHDQIKSLPSADVFVHCGDMTGRGSFPEIISVARWIGSLNYKHKIVIAGNHDFLFERNHNLAHGEFKYRNKVGNFHYLKDSGVEIDGKFFWGSPWQPEHNSWAFNLPRGKVIAEKWSKIPDRENMVLVTHGPPKNILDKTYYGQNHGCEELRKHLDRRKHPVIAHAFGHIHEAYGLERHEKTLYVNCSFVDLTYRHTRKPILLEI